jgi:hypothetical protein
VADEVIVDGPTTSTSTYVNLTITTVATDLRRTVLSKFTEFDRDAHRVVSTWRKVRDHLIAG